MAATCGAPSCQPNDEEIKEKLSRPGPQRVWYLRYALKSGMTHCADLRTDGHRSVVSR